MPKKPIITRTETLAKTRLFHVLRKSASFFNNGTEVEYERLRSPGTGAVLIVPLLQNDTIMLIREYVAGMDCYEVSFPKGVIDPGETAQQARTP